MVYELGCAQCGAPFPEQVECIETPEHGEREFQHHCLACGAWEWALEEWEVLE